METKLLCTLMFFLIGFTVCDAVIKRQVLAGGTGNEKPVDAKIEQMFQNPKITDAASAKIQAKSGSNTVPSNLTPLSYKTQVVAGTNYYVKVRAVIGYETQIWLIKIWEQAWRNFLEVTDVKGPQQESDEIMAF
ncbi:unnamed protein product [Allacma fusca]|uniref:Cystatin domain-containing protein n=1 Tax=Allacma fusca TaxID=39272 RepID=A0A8J2K2G4_9HEXA|nr:unnamed protein product [Allacma fusca]